MTQTIPPYRPNAESTDSYGGSSDQSDPNGWQAYYNYALQLYTAGDEEQANQYYTYAMQLYNAEVPQVPMPSQPPAAAQTTAPETAYPQDSYADAARETSAPEDSTQRVTTPAWEEYYNYAQQLHSSGYQAQAEEYYRYAQQLYDAAEKEIANQPVASNPQVSVAPQAAPSDADSYLSQPAASPTGAMAPQDAAADTISSNSDASPSVADAAGSYAPTATSDVMSSYAPQSAADSDSYAPAAAIPASTDAPALSTADTWAASNMDDVPVKRPKRPFKTKLKIAAISLLAACLMLGIGGFIGLFYVYAEQLKHPSSETAYGGSFVGRLKQSTIPPMIHFLKPAFDKSIRIPAAAQPLLYELNLRATRPAGFLSRSSMTPTTDAPSETRNDAPMVEKTENAAAAAAAVADTDSPTPQAKDGDTGAETEPTEDAEAPTAGDAAETPAQGADGEPAAGTPDDADGDGDPADEPTAAEAVSAASAATGEGEPSPTVEPTAAEGDGDDDAASKDADPFAQYKKNHRSKRSKLRRKAGVKRARAKKRASKKRKNKKNLSGDPMGGFEL